MQTFTGVVAPHTDLHTAAQGACACVNGVELQRKQQIDTRTRARTDIDTDTITHTQTNEQRPGANRAITRAADDKIVFQQHNGAKC